MTAPTRLPMTEADLLRAVIDLLHVFGFRCAHFRPALTARGWRTPVSADGRGFPDILAIRGGPHPRAIALELKSAKGRATEDQLAWLMALTDAGIEARVVRPDDLDDLARELAR